MTNPYYYPEELGLKIVGELSQDDLSYEFNQLVVWKDKKKNLYWASDSGCSCPTPFEDYEYNAGEEPKMERITKQNYKEFKSEVDEFPDSLSSRTELLNKVKKLLEVL